MKILALDGPAEGKFLDVKKGADRIAFDNSNYGTAEYLSNLAESDSIDIQNDFWFYDVSIYYQKTDNSNRPDRYFFLLSGGWHDGLEELSKEYASVIKPQNRRW